MTSHIPFLTLSDSFFENPYLAILVPVGLGNAVALVTTPNVIMGAYSRLKHPPLALPAWAYGPIWMVLYAIMGYASHRAWTVGMASLDPNTVKLTLHGATLYTIQLGLNLVFVPLFFGLKRHIESTVDMVALLATSGYLAYVWNQVDSVVSSLTALYLLWLCFSMYLSLGWGYLNDWSFKSVPKGKKEN